VYAVDKYQMSYWLGITQEGTSQRRGSNMTLVDEALRAFWEARVAVSADANAHVAQALILVIKACNRWLKIKAGKKEVVNLGLFKFKNDLFAKRKAAVLSLARDAMVDLSAYLTQIGPGGTEYADLRSKLHYQENRHKTFEKGGQARTFTKGLEKDFQAERQFWLRSGKTSNISGSHVHATRDLFSEEKLKLRSVQEQLANVPSRDRPEFLRLMKKPVGTLTAADWSKIQRICVSAFPTDTEESTQCKYLKAAERVVALLFPNDAGRLEDKNGNLVNEGRGCIYVMDKYGNLYSNYDSHVIALGSRYLNHSSMLAGDAVICAGNIHTEQGQLTFLDNGSGHYKPNIHQLRLCVTLLLEDGVDLSQTTIEAVDSWVVGAQVRTWNPGRFDAFIHHLPPDSVR
jgi:hypothetical protein